VGEIREGGITVGEKQKPNTTSECFCGVHRRKKNPGENLKKSLGSNEGTSRKGQLKSEKKVAGGQ